MHSVHPQAPSIHRATVTRSWDETALLHGVAFVADGLAERYVAPGQYVTTTLDVGESHFALASAPGVDELELLVKRGTPVADMIAALRPGDELPVAEPAGSGFPIDDSMGRDIVLVAAGAGVAPMRATVRYVLDRRTRYGDVTLFYGQRTPAEFAYAGEFPAWGRGGVHVIPVVSDPATTWHGEVGYVQDALRAHRPDLTNAVAFLCGMPEMVTDVETLLTDLGLASDRIFLNF